jgi:3-oxoacyl-[acyl-carrier protein] reductase
MDLGLSGKRALVMGSSYGMGNGIARGLAAEGADIVLTARSQDILAAEAADIANAFGVRVEAIACDFAREDDVDRLIDFALDQMGGIDIQFNNCGGPPRLLPSEVDDKTWHDWFDLIMMSAIRVTNGTLPGMRERGWGRILSMTSSNIFLAATENVLSSSLRMSLVGWSKSLSNEVAKDGVTVNCLVPGRIETERVHHGDIARAKRAGVTAADIKAKMIAEAPMGRDGTVQEMADAAVLLCSTQARYITGSAIKVDGGRIPTSL